MNVLGIQNVIEASKEAKVKALIYTSTSNVVISKEMVGKWIELDENLPYARHPINAYIKTKIQGEKLVLKAHSEEFKTISIRPCSGVFGPRDNLFLEKILRTEKIDVIDHFF